jgi:hypothetical protein
MPIKFYMMNEDVVHHIWSGEIVQLTKYIEYVKDLESNVGITHHKMTLLYFTFPMIRKKS